MLRMSGLGQSRLGYAEKAERRALFALGYLELIVCDCHKGHQLSDISACETDLAA
jgi:hypothetical protein